MLPSPKERGSTGQRYEWDEAKRVSNLRKHGLDFRDAPLLFEDLHLLGAGRAVDSELRETAIGLIGERYATVVFTQRGTATRIISLRSARDGERRKYQKLLGG